MGFPHRSRVPAQLDWVDTFVREEIEPLDVLFPEPAVPPAGPDPAGDHRSAEGRGRERGLWATHLGPELGGQGFGQLKLALLNEILGRSQWASIVFGCQAPDTGNAEIIAHYGTPEQKQQYLQRFLDGECFLVLLDDGAARGADPTMFTTRASRTATSG